MAKNKCRLFIYGIDENVSNSELKAKFGEHGWITDIYNTGKGYAFVTFHHQSSADRAINDFHGTNLFGKRIKVELANLRAGDEDGDGEDDDEDDDGSEDDDDDEDDSEEEHVDSDGERVGDSDEHVNDSEYDDDDDDSEEEHVDSNDEPADDNEDEGDVLMGMMYDVVETMTRLNLTELNWNGWLVKYV